MPAWSFRSATSMASRSGQRVDAFSMAGLQPAGARRNWASSLLRDGLAAWRKTGARLWLPIFLALEAEAHAKAGRSDTALQVIAEALLISEDDR